MLDPSTMAPPAVSVAEDMLPDILPPLHNARYGASGVALPDGRVVVAGGFRSDIIFLKHDSRILRQSSKSVGSF